EEADMTARSAMLLVVTLFSVGAAADPLGRLFTTPEERAQLQQLRTAPPVVAKPAPPPAPVAVQTPPEVPPVTVNGVVVRSRGESTAWVNGKNTYDGDLSADNRADPRSSARRGLEAGPDLSPGNRAHHRSLRRAGECRLRQALSGDW